MEIPWFIIFYIKNVGGYIVEVYDLSDVLLISSKGCMSYGFYIFVFVIRRSLCDFSV